ncbi:MAG: CvpA family protein [Proteobacteria bacterium]|nr:CvpA family protein [Pseudomonadota bacterium]
MLSSVDWILLGLLALSGLLGALRGFVAEVLSMVAWIAAFWLAFVFGAPVADMLRPDIDDAAGRLLLAYALVFVAALLVGSVVSWIAAKAVKSMGLGDVNRFLGLLYGLGRGALLGCLLVLLLGWTALPREPQWRASPLIPLYQTGAEAMKAWLPDAAAQHVSFESVVAQGQRKVIDAVTGQVLASMRGDGAASSAQASSTDGDGTAKSLPTDAEPATAAGSSEGSSHNAVKSAETRKGRRRPSSKNASPGD